MIRIEHRVEEDRLGSKGGIMGDYKNLTGARIGRLTVVQNTHQKSKNVSFIWKCLCDCGSEVFLPKSILLVIAVVL